MDRSWDLSCYRHSGTGPKNYDEVGRLYTCYSLRCKSETGESIAIKYTSGYRLIWYVLTKIRNVAPPSHVTDTFVEIPVIEIVHVTDTLFRSCRGVLTTLGIYKVRFGCSSIFNHVASPINQGGKKPDIWTRSILKINEGSERMMILICLPNGSDHKVTPVIWMVRGPGKRMRTIIMGVITVHGFRRRFISWKLFTTMPQSTLRSSKDIDITPISVEGGYLDQRCQKDCAGDSQF